MPLSLQALNEKEANLRAINHLLYKVRKDRLRNGRAYQPLILTDPSLYLTLYIEAGDPVEYFRKGYVVEIDTKTFRAIGARYFVSEGKDTYTEVELSNKQCRDLYAYYKINELDLVDMFAKKLKE